MSDTYYRHVHIRIPGNLPFDPKAIHSLMVSVFALEGFVTLAISFRSNRIEWYVEVANPQVEALKRIIYRYYPTAAINSVAPPAPEHGRYRFDIMTAAPFIGPLLHVTDFGKTDPLASLVNAASGLATSESILYEVRLTPVSQESLTLGRQLATQSLSRWWDYLTPGGLIGVAFRKAMGVDRTDRYVSTLQKLIEHKLATPLKEATVSLKIKAGSESRVENILSAFGPAFALYERTFSNHLVAAQEGAYPLVLMPEEVAAFWHLPNEQCQVPGILSVTAASVPIPVSLTKADDGVVLGWSEYQGVRSEVRIPATDRVTHVNIIGKTGMGKSTMLHHLIHQDIKAGRGVGVIDPHGSLVSAILETSIPPEREQDVVLFDSSDHDFPVGLNILTAPNGVLPETVASQALGVLRKMFADSWSATRMEDALYAALISLTVVEGATLQDIPRLFNNSNFRAEVIRQVRDPVALEFWLDEYEPLSQAYKGEFARPITNRIRRFYRNREVRRIVCQKDSLDCTQIIETGKIFLANLGGLPEIEAETVGALLISKLQIAAMSRQVRSNRPPFFLCIDEVQNFTTTSLAKMFSEARKYGLSLSVANQYLKQLEGDTLQAVLGNAGTSILFRCDPGDAQMLSAFTKPAFGTDELTNLNRFTAVVKLQSGGTTQPAFSLTLNPPLKPTSGSTAQAQRIREHSRTQYAKSAAVVDEEIASRYDHSPVSSAPDETNQEENYFE